MHFIYGNSCNKWLNFSLAGRPGDGWNFTQSPGVCCL